MSVNLLHELIKKENNRKWPTIGDRATANDLQTILFEIEVWLAADSSEGFKVFKRIIDSKIEEHMKSYLQNTCKKEAA